MATVSIIIPCFNDGKYLPEAVASALAQTCADTEILIVDDHSTDPLTLAVLREMEKRGIRVLQTPPGKKGPSAARNAGVNHAAGKYIFPLDADDKIAPTCIQKMLAVMENDPEIRVCACEIQFFGLKNKKWLQPTYSFKALVLEEIKLSTSSLYLRKDWERVNGYDESLTYREDMVFWMDILRDSGRAFVIPEPLLFYRIRPYSLTAALITHPSENERVRMLYAARAGLFQEHTLDFMERCAEYQDEKARLTCLVSWKALSPLFRLEWRLRQRVKRLLGRA